MASLDIDNFLTASLIGRQNAKETSQDLQSLSARIVETAMLITPIFDEANGYGVQVVVQSQQLIRPVLLRLADQASADVERFSALWRDYQMLSRNTLVVEGCKSSLLALKLWN